MLFAGRAHSVPVVPSFSMGKMTTRTETTQETTELIRSIDYNTGWSYAVSGTGVEPSSGDVSVSSANLHPSRSDSHKLMDAIK